MQAAALGAALWSSMPLQLWWAIPIWGYKPPFHPLHVSLWMFGVEECEADQRCW